MVLLTVEAGGSLPLLPALKNTFSLWGCLVQPWWEVFCLVLLYFVKVMFGCSLLGAFFFSDGIRRRRDLGERGHRRNFVVCRKGNGGQDVLYMRIFCF